MRHAVMRRYFKHGVLPQLMVFDAVARHGSFTRAGEELYLAQPTVSVQLKKLADTVGLPLVEQAGKRIHLTEAGRELHSAIEELFRVFARAEEKLSSLRDPDTGRFRVAISTTAKYFAPRLLGHFCQEHPNAQVSMHVDNRERLLERMAANQDDVYVLSYPPADIALTLHKLLPNRLHVYGRSDHPFARRKRVPIEELAKQPLLMRELGSGTRLMTQGAFEKHGLRPNVRMEIGSDEAIKQAIIGGLGVSVLSEHTLRRTHGDVADEGLVELDVEGFPLDGWWYLAYPAARKLSPTAQVFVDQTLDLAQSLSTPAVPAPTPAPVAAGRTARV
jgi:DNA-binding transcriptional LysR family regulator